MKKIYMVVMAGMLCVSGVSAAGPFKVKASYKPALKKSYRAAGQSIMRPLSETEYEYMDGDWEVLGTTAFTYDSKGNVLTELTEEGVETVGADASRMVIYTYDEFNQILTKVEREKVLEVWTDMAKTDYVWDAVVHDFFTSRMSYDRDGEAWTPNYKCETNTVTRNAAGNVTEVVKALPLDDEMVDAYRLVWGYGADGKANEYRYFANNAGTAVPEWELEDGLSLRNIVWDRTDGQLVDDDTNNYLEGPNRISSADVYVDDELDGHVIVEYFADKPSDYFVKQTFNDVTEVGATTRKTVTDANGSYVIESLEYVDEDDNISQEPVMSEKIVEEYDDHGNIVREIYVISEDGESFMMGYSYDLTYDAQGNLKEVIINTLEGEDEDTAESEPVSRIVYGEYVDASLSVAAVKTAADTFPAIVYNAQGIAVARVDSAAGVKTLPAGLYIVNGRKVIVR